MKTIAVTLQTDDGTILAGHLYEIPANVAPIYPPARAPLAPKLEQLEQLADGLIKERASGNGTMPVPVFTPVETGSNNTTTQATVPTPTAPAPCPDCFDGTKDGTTPCPTCKGTNLAPLVTPAQ